MLRKGRGRLLRPFSIKPAYGVPKKKGTAGSVGVPPAFLRPRRPRSQEFLRRAEGSVGRHPRPSDASHPSAWAALPRTLRCSRCREPAQSGLKRVAQDFTGRFVFPRASLLQWPVEGNGARLPAIHNAAAAVPAFVGMQNNRRISLFGIWNINIHLADIDAGIAARAELRIYNNRRVRRRNVRQSADLDSSHSYFPL